MEELKDESIEDLKITTDYDNRSVYLNFAGKFDQAVITVFADKKLVHRGITSEKSYTITLDDIHPWSLEDPFLYDLYIATSEETIKSYFGIRKISKRRDDRDIMRFYLNDKPVFLSGFLQN